ncbi:NAD(P)/FAD-dependent oxidoreductase [Serpentinicella sp. ANB-PHB4]|uniref:NAD(P)/FAD-dependent oxidoreductase n=1 Tax=Serpentinicella sp. ANB-PHB4 TaxID=3074076 RepID=UPI0028657C2B|nr:NAD(P)/FAD-dependent oxidoreductase [Serpentinicella sp. ANB-PHB4]MDR5659439.1 NAD(P)/FAD-dependent oxidoreductase [Serpentinicella sp. ANB-PHB4]
MKVAIMGAGLSGLSCAITLEKNGIKPTIFEKRRVVGDRFINAEIFMSILTRPVVDEISYLSEEHDINLHPLSNIKELQIISEKEKATIEGHIGFTSLRGRDVDSLENQLARQVKSKIIFNSKYTYEHLLQEFTHVIVATGDAAYTSKIQLFSNDLTVTLKGATVEGNFDQYGVKAWLNHHFAPKGYGYFIPLSDKEAQIVIGFPDYEENKKLDEEMLWDRFYNQACKDLNQNLRITDQFQVTRYQIGTCQTPRIGNTFFVGNCFGSIMPFLGFGQFSAMLTGIYAAHDLCGFGKYEDLTSNLKESYRNSLSLRHGIENLSNSQLDLMVKSLDGKIGKRLFNSKYDFLSLAGYLLRPLTKNKE